MSLLKDAVKVMRDVVLLNDKVERTSTDLERLADKIYDHEKRLVKVETVHDLVISRFNSVRQLDDKDL